MLGQVEASSLHAVSTNFIPSAVVLTIDGVALHQVVVILAGQKAVAIASDDAFNVAMQLLALHRLRNKLRYLTHC